MSSAKAALDSDTKVYPISTLESQLGVLCMGMRCRCQYNVGRSLGMSLLCMCCDVT